MIHDDDDSMDRPMLQAVDPEIVADGSAADSADGDLEQLRGLPRILRYALLVHQSRDDIIEHRLVAEIDELCPQMPQNAAWAIARDFDTGLVLSKELDQLAVIRDLPTLRTLSDCVQLLTLLVPVDFDGFQSYRRVTRAMIYSLDQVAAILDDKTCAELEELIYGFAALPAATGATRKWSAISHAARLGQQSTRHRIREAVVNAARHIQRGSEQRTQSAMPPAEQAAAEADDPDASINRHDGNTLIVGRMTDLERSALKLPEPLRHVLRSSLPLVQTPHLDGVRIKLMNEFPYAADVIDSALTDLIGRPTIRIRPLLLVGEPGGGKSRFARRFAEILGLTIWRTDAAQSDGSVFSGTDRRWHTSQPCHPFLAIARGRIANPLILIDEIEKAGTRDDYGRLWDCLLGLLEPETSARYPDPALQITLDLSHVSYVATANTIEPLPPPLLTALGSSGFLNRPAKISMR